MPALKALALATAGLGLAATANAAGDFSFDYHYSQEDVATPEGAEIVLSELETQIEDECRFSRITDRLAFARQMSQRCVEDSLENAVSQIDAPHLDAALEDWKENRV